VEWAKKTGRIKGAEQQELIDFARKVLANAEANGELITDGNDETPDDEPPAPQRRPSSKKPGV
jgi:hypothetical protein